jgi:hypothetical protein
MQQLTNRRDILGWGLLLGIVWANSWLPELLPKIRADAKLAKTNRLSQL